MHRKIKSKNRKKLKPVDPFNLNARVDTQKQKNLPPKDEDQEIPRSFKDLFMNPDNDPAKKRPKKKKTDPNMIEGYVKKPWETDKQFLNRVQRSTYDYVNDQMTKIKYGLIGFEPSDVLNTEKKPGKRRAGRDDLDDSSSSKKKRKSVNDGGQSSSDQGSSRKANRMAERKRRKKNKREEVDPLYMREVIPFGTRVDEPPRLTAVPKKAKKEQPTKAGARDLLLKQQLQPSGLGVDSKRYENDGTIKCDDVVKQRMLEEERRRVIEAYRVQKKTRKPIDHKE